MTSSLHILKVISISLLTLILIQPPAYAAPLRIAIINIHCLLDDWENRIPKILDEIIKNESDVIGFQEVCIRPQTGENQIRAILDYLNGHNYGVRSYGAVYTHRAWDTMDEYILTVSRREATAIETGLLPPSLLQRGYVTLNLGFFRFVNTHLEYREDNSQSRRDQLEFLYQRHKDSPFIIGGDFNSSPFSTEQAWLRDLSFKSHFPGWSHSGEDGNSSHQIDGFWISPNYLTQIVSSSAWLFLKEKYNDRPLSDHFGVMLEIKAKDK